MSEVNKIETSAAPLGFGPYSQALRAGDFVYISGQGPLDPESGRVVPGDIESQTRLTVKHIENIAKAAGGSLDDVVKVNVYLSSIDLYERFNEVYRSIFDNDPRPTRTTVAAGLKGIDIEVDAVLYLSDR